MAENTDKTRSLYSPERGMIACVLLQAAFGGDRRPCHYFGSGDWETGFPDDTFGWVELTMKEWRILGAMPKEDRIARLAHNREGV